MNNNQREKEGAKGSLPSRLHIINISLRDNKRKVSTELTASAADLIYYYRACRNDIMLIQNLCWLPTDSRHSKTGVGFARTPIVIVNLLSVRGDARFPGDGRSLPAWRLRTGGKIEY